jgi:phenylacetate-CoA ligase
MPSAWVKSQWNRALISVTPKCAVSSSQVNRAAASPPSAPVLNSSGTEVGPVTYECPAQPGVLHVIEAGYYPEIIDPKSGNPTLSDEPGELVLTTLGRIASPLLRYRTGDLVKRGTRNAERGTGPCACGSHELALTGGILGRVDDMVIVRGVNVYPGAVEEIVRSVNGIAEYQVTVTTRSALTELGLTIEPAPDCPDAKAVAQNLASALETALSLRVPVTLATPGSLPRFEMKASRWLHR